jgi:hypothetical protein
MTSRRRRDRQLLPHCFWMAHFWYRRCLRFRSNDNPYSESQATRRPPIKSGAAIYPSRLKGSQRSDTFPESHRERVIMSVGQTAGAIKPRRLHVLTFNHD